MVSAESVIVTDEVSPLARWRKSLSNGLEILLGSWLLIFLLIRLQSRLGGPEWLWAILDLIPSLLTCCGFWLVTMRHPECAEYESGRIVRLVTRWLAVTMAVMETFDAAGYAAGLWAWDACIPIALPVLAIHTAVFAVFLTSLARRFERPQLVWQTYAAMWGLALGLFLFWATLPFWGSLGENELPKGGLLAALAGSLFIMLSCGIWTLVTVWRYKQALGADANRSLSQSPQLAT